MSSGRNERSGPDPGLKLTRQDPHMPTGAVPRMQPAGWEALLPDIAAQGGKLDLQLVSRLLQGKVHYARIHALFAVVLRAYYIV